MEGAFLAYPVAYAKPLILTIEVAMTLTHRGDARPAACRRAGTERATMNARPCSDCAPPWRLGSVCLA